MQDTKSSAYAIGLPPRIGLATAFLNRDPDELKLIPWVLLFHAIFDFLSGLVETALLNYQVVQRT